MRGKKRKIAVTLIEKDHIFNQRLVEYLAEKYKEGEIKNGTV